MAAARLDSGQWSVDSGQWSVDSGRWSVVFVFGNSCLFLSVYGLDMGIYIYAHTHSLIHCDLSLFCLFGVFLLLWGVSFFIVLL